MCLPDGGEISWARALLRFVGACLSWSLLGAGYLWALFDSRNQTLHDHLSGTQLVYTEKGRKKGTKMQENLPDSSERDVRGKAK